MRMNTRHPLQLIGGLILLFSPIWLFLLDQAGLPFGGADPLNIALALAGIGGVFIVLSQRGRWARMLVALVISAVMIVAQFYAIAALVASTI